MKVVQINATCGMGSTGKICLEVSKLLTKRGIENYILYSSGYSDYPLGIKYTSDLYIKTQALKTRLNGNYGFNSQLATKRLIAHLEKIGPDVVHLHNMHSHNCNIERLMEYLKQKHIHVFWTFHDCWAITAYCPHFTLEKCDKWETGCSECPQRGRFSRIFDKSTELYRRKKDAAVGVDLTIITPSVWLKDIVKRSFLKECPVKVINNGIDLSVFVPNVGDFREKYQCGERFIVLGVAYRWAARKGLDVFVELSKRLDAEKYQIVLVGTDDATDKQLPENIISVHHTSNQAELAEIYTAADVFANPTREDTFPTVNIESIACGTPVVTFKTGGSPEIPDETCGSVVSCDDIDAMEKEIVRICETSPYSCESCIKRAKQFDSSAKYAEYVELYEVINGKKQGC